MQDRVVIFGSNVRISETAYLTASFFVPPGDPCCHGNEIWDKIGYNSACVRNIPEISPCNGVFGVGLLNDARQIRPRPTAFAMATKFGTQ